MIESIGFVLTAGAGGLTFVLLTLLRDRNNGPVFGDRCVFCLLALPLSVFLSHFLYCVVQPHMILPEKGFDLSCHSKWIFAVYLAVCNPVLIA